VNFHPHLCVCVFFVYKLVILLDIHVAEILLPDLLLYNNHWIKDVMNRYQFVAGHRLFEILQLGKSIC
jgi:hypothetical protein